MLLLRHSNTLLLKSFETKSQPNVCRVCLCNNVVQACALFFNGHTHRCHIVTRTYDIVAREQCGQNITFYSEHEDGIRQEHATACALRSLIRYFN